MAPLTANVRKKPVSLRDIAREVGVSVATVSYAVNGRPGLMTQKTREKILDAVKRLDYQPNGLMRAVRTRRSGVVGVMVASFQTTFFPQIIDGIECALMDFGYHAVMCQSHSDDRLAAENLAMLRQRRVDGLIVTPKFNGTELYRPILAAGIRTVFVDAYLPELEIPSVQSDDDTGSYLATRHLISKGHRRIGTLRRTDALLFGNMLDRFNGYRRALAEAGIAYDEALVRVVDPGASVEQGRQAGLALLTETDATAIFSPLDFGALGIMQAARDCGRAIPDNLAVVGYCNQEAGRFTTPPLTTVDQKPQEIGRVAVHRLMALIHGKPDPLPLHCFITPELLIRGSS
jgi:LacI family transcriptional regulator